jgi:AcrR family transcriptional regulator
LPPVTREPRSQQRREEIVLAAYRLFAERGYHETNVADIADALEMGHGTFYRSFASKRDVFDHVVELAVRKIAEAVSVEDPRAANSLADYRAQMDRLCQVLFALMENDPQVAQLFLYEAPGLDSSLNDKLHFAMEQFAIYSAQYLVNGQEKKFLRRDIDVLAIARAVNGMIFEATRSVHRAADRKLAAEQWLAAIRVLLLEGLIAR